MFLDLLADIRQRLFGQLAAPGGLGRAADEVEDLGRLVAMISVSEVVEVPAEYPASSVHASALCSSPSWLSHRRAGSA